MIDLHFILDEEAKPGFEAKKRDLIDSVRELLIEKLRDEPAQTALTLLISFFPCTMAHWISMYLRNSPDTKYAVLQLIEQKTIASFKWYENLNI